jgi:membrane protein required for colicin V production
MDDLPLNVVDIAVLLVLLISGGLAFMRGFVHETLSAASWVGAAIFALLVYPKARPAVGDHISTPLIADAVTAISLFLIALVILATLTHLISRRVQKSSLGAVDRSLGLVFGLFRGLVVLCLVWLVFLWVFPRDDHPEWITEARALPILDFGSDQIRDLLPEHLRQEGEEAGQTLREGGEVLRQNDETFRKLIEPSAKDGAPEEESGYKSDMRDDMERAVDSILQNDGSSQ